MKVTFKLPKWGLKSTLYRGTAFVIGLVLVSWLIIVAIENEKNNGKLSYITSPDGQQDVIVSYWAGVNVCPGTETFYEERENFVVHRLFAGVAVGDIDGNGFSDIVSVTVYDIERHTEGDIGVYLNNGQELSGRTVISNDDYFGVTLYDYDTDGDLDILTVADDGVFVYLNDSLSFERKQKLIDIRATGIAAADFNNDGLMDVVTVGNLGAYIHTGIPDSCKFYPPTLVSNAIPGRGVTAYDEDKDGLPDIVVINDQGTFILRNTGSNCGFAPPEKFSSSTGNGIAIADLVGKKKEHKDNG